MAEGSPGGSPGGRPAPSQGQALPGPGVGPCAVGLRLDVGWGPLHWGLGDTGKPWTVHLPPHGDESAFSRGWETFSI